MKIENYLALLIIVIDMLKMLKDNWNKFLKVQLKKVCFQANGIRKWYAQCTRIWEKVKVSQQQEKTADLFKSLAAELTRVDSRKHTRFSLYSKPVCRGAHEHSGGGILLESFHAGFLWSGRSQLTTSTFMGWV